MVSTENDILEMKGIAKNFAGIRALDNVSFSLKKGEIHALLGENGAGKSTLMNILSGSLKQDSGEMYLFGKKYTPRMPLDARKSGVIKVHQELQLIPEMTVAENIFLGSEPMNGRHNIDYNMMNKEAQRLLDEVDADFSSKDFIKHLSVAQKQMVEIAKAINQKLRILILDEPTSSLTDKEIDKLFEIVKRLSSEGKSVIYISHRLAEIFKIADRVTVFRDGKFIRTAFVSELTNQELVKLMVGRTVKNDITVDYEIKGKTILEVENLSDRGKVKDVSFQLHKGEILGIAGLVGSGRTETAKILFGCSPKYCGKIFIDGKEIRILTPAQAIGLGIMLIPEDRKLEGLILKQTVRSNIVLASLPRYIRHGVINFSSVDKSVNDSIANLSISPKDASIAARCLSGGNQQKVVIAKALQVAPTILILDEPTRGIDVNAKYEIYQLIKKLALKGMSIIMISSELPEILLMSQRIAVMHEGKVAGIISGRDATEEKIMALAMGVEKNA